ncbi:MAG TPA: hypothetical protein VKE51_34810, partial [Vicinamibacterales bacterium]|nr:hypothetical protein [Vicinamibacterales bacterium]
MKGARVDWMAAENVFAAWTRPDVIWSDWAKPVAFVAPALGAAAAGGDLPPAPALAMSPDPTAAVIVDLPGPESVSTGVLLAERGFCPVPLFNGTSGPSSVIDVDGISGALVAGAERLRHLQMSSAAPPAFLLDARRLESTGIAPGKYDNRWIALPQDFPSGALLASRGIRSAALVRREGLSIPTDLAHVLARWAEHGIRLRVIDVATGQVADEVQVPKPSRFKLAWYAAIALMGLRRNNVGGFGAT